MWLPNKIKSFFPSSNSLTKSSGWWSVLGDWSLGGSRVDDAKLLKEGYIQNAHVHAITSKIAQKAGTIPIEVKVNGEIEEEGEAVNLLAGDKLSKEDFIEQSILSLILTGDLFYLVTEVNGITGKTLTFEMLNAGGVTINQTKQGGIKNYQYDDQYNTYTYSPEDILHIKYYDPTLYGLESMRLSLIHI